MFKVSSLNPSSASFHGFVPYSTFNPNLHIIIAVRIRSGDSWVETVAMVDSGCSENVIDSRFADSLSSKATPKSQPLQLTMADGESSSGGIVTHELQTQLQIGPH